MKQKTSLLFLLSFFTLKTVSQSNPLFGDEIKVTITGLTFDAMEPFISLDGNTLFFNSLNSGGNTNLYYATKVNDSTFNYIGLVAGTHDTSANHLDGVASLDVLNNFFWTSLRGYPTHIENLHRGVYNNGSVSTITRVYGNFNSYSFNYPYGWLIMDAAINDNGNLLYYCNAKFDFSNTICVGIPCEAKIGVAQKVNDSTFHKIPNSSVLFDNINDTINYILYAPQITNDGLELYFTRLLKGSHNTEICVAVRTNTNNAFNVPTVIYSNNGYVPEAATITTDKQKIYYHQKDNTGIFHIYLRYKVLANNLTENIKTTEITVYPNPIKNKCTIVFQKPINNFTVSVFSVIGEKIFETTNATQLDLYGLQKGIYFIKVNNNNLTMCTKIVKE